MWESLALLGLLVLWGVFGLAAWCVALVVGRGRVRLWRMPLALAAGVGGGALVPALGANDGLGFAISLLTALAAGAVASAVVVRRAANAPRREPS